MVPKEFLKSLLLSLKKLRSPSLTLEEFAELVEKEFFREFKKEIKVVTINVGIVLIAEDGATIPALSYLFDDYYWVVRFNNKAVERCSHHYADENFKGLYYQAKLKDCQRIEYADGKEVLYQNNKKGIVFYNLI